MTNFENWKQNLTIKQLFDFFDVLNCDSCPAAKYCETNGAKSCKNTFEKWAIKEKK